MKRINEAIDMFMVKAKTFTVCDFGMAKMGLVSFGAIIGTYFSLFLLPYIQIIWAIAIVSYTCLIFRLLKLTGSIMNRARNLKFLDFWLIELTIIPFGMLLGIYFTPFIMPSLWLLWIVFVCSYTCILIRVLFD